MLKFLRFSTFCYDLTLASLLDRNALLTKKFKMRPLVPWFRRGNHTTHLMNAASREFFKEFIDKNQKDLFTATRKVLNRDILFPPSDDKLTLTN